jgi:hypothetical protein
MGNNGKIDLDPRHSSYFTGAGLPWSGMETGRPDDPQFGAYMTPDQMKGMDFGNWAKAQQQRAALAGGDQERAYGARASKYMGGAGSNSADSARRVSDIMAQTQNNLGNIAADRQMQEFNSKVAEANAYNQSMQMANQLKADKYNRDAAEFNAEQGARGGLISGGLGILGTIGGGIAGGLPGAMAGGQLGQGIGNMALGKPANFNLSAPMGQQYDEVSLPDLPDGELGVGGDILDMDPELLMALERAKQRAGALGAQ